MIGWAASGCTLLGAGVGAGIDAAVPGPYETVPAESHRRLEYGDQVILFMRDGRRLEERYVGVHGPTERDVEVYVLLEGPDGVQSVPMSNVVGVAIDVGGKGWLCGAAVGAVVDAVVVTFAIVALANMEMDLSNSGMEWGK